MGKVHIIRPVRSESEYVLFNPNILYDLGRYEDIAYAYQIDFNAAMVDAIRDNDKQTTLQLLNGCRNLDVNKFTTKPDKYGKVITYEIHKRPFKKRPSDLSRYKVARTLNFSELSAFQNNLLVDEEEGDDVESWYLNPKNERGNCT